MKRLLAITAMPFLLLLSGCQSAGVQSGFMVKQHLAGGSSYNEIAEIDGVTTEVTVFKLEHGDCAGDDCSTDRQRIEHTTRPMYPHGKVNYQFSLFVPEDFDDLTPAHTQIAQGKMPKIRLPLWSIKLHENTLVIRSPVLNQQCALWRREQMNGNWTSFDITVDYGMRVNPMASKKQNPSLEVKINGDVIPKCSIYDPIVTTSIAGNEYEFRYGMYVSSVSAWLAKENPEFVESMNGKIKPFNDVHTRAGYTATTFTNRPFKLNWGIELPVRILKFSPVKISYVN